MHLRGAQAAERELRVDASALARIAAALKHVTTAIPDSSVDAVEILRWPGVVEAISPDSDELLAAGRTLFQQTLDDLGAMRFARARARRLTSSAART